MFCFFFFSPRNRKYIYLIKYDKRAKVLRDSLNLTWPNPTFRALIAFHSWNLRGVKNRCRVSVGVQVTAWYLQSRTFNHIIDQNVNPPLNHIPLWTRLEQEKKCNQAKSFFYVLLFLPLLVLVHLRAKRLLRQVSGSHSSFYSFWPAKLKLLFFPVMVLFLFHFRLSSSFSWLFLILKLVQ